MPWCPDCKSEYRDGFDVCSDCGASLVDEYPQEPQANGAEAHDDSISSRFLINADNPVEADMIIAMLEAGGVHTLRKIKDAGGYLQLYMGNVGTAAFGVDIYVSSEDFERAKELTEAYFAANLDESEPEGNEPEGKYEPDCSIDGLSETDEEKSAGESFENRRRVVIIGILIVVGLSLLGYLGEFIGILTYFVNTLFHFR